MKSFEGACMIFSGVIAVIWVDQKTRSNLDQMMPTRKGFQNLGGCVAEFGSNNPRSLSCFHMTAFWSPLTLLRGKILFVRYGQESISEKMARSVTTIIGIGKVKMLEGWRSQVTVMMISEASWSFVRVQKRIDAQKSQRGWVQIGVTVLVGL